MALTQWEAMWFLPFVAPLCLYVCYTDLSQMRITNQAVIALALVFVIIGPFALPFETYLYRLAQMVGMLVLGMVLNAVGAMGAGDSKFLAAAAPYIVASDFTFVMVILTASFLGAFIAHRLAKNSPLRQLAPNWVSWTRGGQKFPAGLAFGFALIVYLAFGLTRGA